MYAEDAHRYGRARGAEDRADPGRTKKRRGGGGSGGESTGNSYSALVPEAEWEYVVTRYAEAFGQDWWAVYECERPERVWFAFYHLDDAQRIDALRRELDDFDRACLTAGAMNDTTGKFIAARRNDLRARLRNDPHAPEAPKFTSSEMRDAAQRLMSSVLSTGKLPKVPPS